MGSTLSEPTRHPFLLSAQNTLLRTRASHSEAIILYDDKLISYMALAVTGHHFQN